MADVKIFSQWVPSHVNVYGNEIADGLAREGSHKASTHGGCLTFSEIVTQLGTNSSRDETILARLRSGRTRAQRHVAGLKVYPPCSSKLQCDSSWFCPAAL
ncbi:hypothetical protein TNCV_1251031 [Trichonephila clavipes]|nr:hypothetical protein TNCV_1251031 [Trichonephila clavipes]